MAYTIVKNEQSGNARLLDIDTGLKDANGDEIIERFAWGMDVPWATVQAETKALLDLKYGANATSLGKVGTTL